MHFPLYTGADIQPYLKNVLTHIRQCLPIKDQSNAGAKKKSPPIEPAVFACISMLARAVREGIKHDVSAMLDSMLSAGLSPALTTALYKLALYIPAFKKEIAEGLLKILSLILMQQPFRHPGTPKVCTYFLKQSLPAEVKDNLKFPLHMDHLVLL